MKQLSLKIYGHVQGVGFRYMARKKAKELSLTGYIKNNIDGTVEAVVEGLDENLQIFLTWCYNGVKSTRVERIEEDWGEAEGKYKEFFIK